MMLLTFGLVSQPFQYSDLLYPACMPPPLSEDVRYPPTEYAGETVVLAGWGCLHEQCPEDTTPILVRDATVEVITNELAMCWYAAPSLPCTNVSETFPHVFWSSRFMNDSLVGGRAEYVPDRVFIVGGDEIGSVSPCLGDSGSPVIRYVETDGRPSEVQVPSCSEESSSSFSAFLRQHLGSL